MKPRVYFLDHLVLTVTDIAASCHFYETALGMRSETFYPADGTERTALSFGTQKINLHLAGAEFEPKARVAKTGSADLCFLSDQPLDSWQAHFAKIQVEVEDGPVRRAGATGPIQSLYIRDPDGNLIEISNMI